MSQLAVHDDQAVTVSDLVDAVHTLAAIVAGMNADVRKLLDAHERIELVIAKAQSSRMGRTLLGGG